MKLLELTAAAALLLSVASAKHSHNRRHLEALERRHKHHARDPLTSSAESGLKKRTTCHLPSDDSLVFVPGAQNGGFAMSPDQPCTAGMNCPYACPPGQMMAQWKPGSNYGDTTRMAGGLLCNSDGTTSKPFPSKPYCMTGGTNIGVVDKTGKGCSWCQTVLPGNEAMLIPTWVDADGSATLAMPNTNYWQGTSAHYYINPPGVSVEDGCIWGTKNNPHGNWAAFVAGGNIDSNGNAFIKLGMNPVYLEAATPFRDVVPTYGVKIECEPEGACNGLPCAFDPSVNKVNQLTGEQTVSGNGDAFCVVTVPSHAKANFVYFDTGSGSNHSPPKPKPPPPAPKPSSVTPPLTTSSSSTSSSESSTTTESTSSSETSSSSSTIRIKYSPHVLLENATSAYPSGTGASTYVLPTASSSGPPSATSPISGATSSGAAYHLHATAAGIGLSGIAAFAALVL